MGAQHQIVIRREGRPDHVFNVEAGVYPIGSDGDNRIILPDASVNWRHAILSVLPDGVYIEDLMTDAGIELEGRRVEGRQPIPPGAEIRIGSYRIFCRPLDAAGRPFGRAPAPAPTPEPPPTAPPTTPPPPAPAAPGPEPAPEPDRAAPEPGPPRARSDEETRRRSVRRQVQRELVQRLDIKRLAASHVDENELRQKALESIRQIVRDVRARLPGDIDPERLTKEVYDEAVGLGPLEDLLADPEITEIMVNGPDRVYIEKEGKLYLTGRTFLDEDSVLAVIERIVAPIGRRIDESQPYVDARLRDGSRVNAIIHPLSLVGPCLTIRKFSKTPYTAEDLIRFGTWTPGITEFVRACVLLRKNIVISGGTGSGKTTLLNVISGYLPQDERIVTIEDAAELRLNQPHVIRLEARPPNIEGRGAITVRDLVRNALRMRPDRIVVGECRGGEALDMLQAMNTGHEGSLTTVHANSPRDALARLETMVLMAGMELPLRAIREQIGSAIHLIVHESRFSDGTRKISRISELVGLEGDQITMQDLFVYEQTGIDENNRVLGHFTATGSVPTFLEDLRVRGIRLRQSVFEPGATVS